jgi:quercetin dioxygenase-like cupin family protein
MSSQMKPAITASNPVVKNFCYTPATPALWRNGFWPFLQYRDLGLYGTSQGEMGAEHVKYCGQGASTGWFRHNLSFDWLYVIKGRVSVGYETGEKVTLKNDDAILMPADFGLRFFDFSADYEALEITAPAVAQVIQEKTPSKSKASARPIVNYDSPECHVTGEGLRRFFKYRELGIAEATQRKYQLHVITIAEKSPGGTGWHYHGASQFAYVLDGQATVGLRDQKPVDYRASDSMCVCQGYVHDVPDYSMAYKVIELITPADYETIDV